MKSKAIFLAAIVALFCGLSPAAGVWTQGGWKWRSMQERGLNRIFWQNNLFMRIFKYIK